MSAPEQLARPVRPLDVSRAFWLWLASAAVSLVGQLVAMPSTAAAVHNAVDQPARPGTHPLSPATMESIARAGFVVGLTVMILLTLLLVYFGFRMRAGRSWARVVITVVVGLDVVFLAFSPPSVGDSGSLIQTASALIGVAAVIFMYRPTTREHFAQTTKPPAQTP